MKKEFNIFLTAIMFYTRIPVHHIEGSSEDMLNQSTRYFPFVGWLTGGLAALVFFTAHLVYPASVSILLSMAATILFTGAFHEDGFADFCDGFGGGYTKEKILEIMKDSRIGTYGSTGLLMMLLIKFFLLLQFEPALIPVVLIAGHTFSRLMPVLLIYTSKYARSDATSKTKPIGKADPGWSLVLAVVFGIVPLSLIPWQWAASCIFVLLFMFVLFRLYIKKKLGGYTGDVLGALQQLSELFFYLSVLATQNLLS